MPGRQLRCRLDRLPLFSSGKCGARFQRWSTPRPTEATACGRRRRRFSCGLFTFSHSSLGFRGLAGRRGFRLRGLCGLRRLGYWLLADLCQSPFNDVRATAPPDDLVFRRVAQKSVLQGCPESVTPVGQRHPRPGNTPPQTPSHPSPPTGLRRAPSDGWDRPLASPPSPRARHRDGPLAGLLRLKLRPGTRRRAHRGARGRPRRRPCCAGAARHGRRPARGRC